MFPGTRRGTFILENTFTILNNCIGNRMVLGIYARNGRIKTG